MGSREEWREGTYIIGQNLITWQYLAAREVGNTALSWVDKFYYKSAERKFSAIHLITNVLLSHCAKTENAYFLKKITVATQMST